MQTRFANCHGTQRRCEHGGVVKLVGGRLRLSASDVANYVACGHLTRLDLLHARGEIQPPHAFDIGFEDLVARGEAHERAVLARFRADGWRVAEIPESAPQAEAVQAMLAAIDDGFDVVYQGVLQSDEGAGGAFLLGRPDFLVRAGLLRAVRLPEREGADRRRRSGAGQEVGRAPVLLPAAGTPVRARGRRV